ncbi:MAG: hypothetical protein HXX19_12560 [Rhodoferax sp.]|nr:hypothetical protein [Rhodoferax sp.]
MKFLWPVLLVLLRALYFLYSLWCLLFPLAFAWLVLALVQDQTLFGLNTQALRYTLLVAFAGFALLVLSLVYVRRSRGDPNPFQSAFLSWFGTLRGFWHTQPGDMVKLKLPSGYLVENPQAYRVGGKDIHDILQRIQPGDILLRGFDGYVDGIMIRHASVCSDKGFQPGWFTHAALYMGAVGAEDRSHVPAAFRNNPAYFQEGPQMLVHAMAKGVHCQDLLTFCRSDYLAVLRIKPGLAQVDLGQAIHNARIAALKKIGDSYDFNASDTTRFHRFSCSELVYYCLHSIHDALQLKPLLHAIYPLSPLNRTLTIFKRVTIIPDDFYALVRSGALECVWMDPISATQCGSAPQAT